MGIYEKLGVRPVVNACGTMTTLGGTTIAPEVLQAMDEAARDYVDMVELMGRAAEVIATITGAEDGLVTSGAAASLALAAAGCMTGTNPFNAIRLPDTTGLKNEIIVQRLQRGPHDHHLRVAGAKVIEIGNMFKTPAWELESVISERTAAVAYFIYDPQPSILHLDEVISIAHRHHLPVIVDAAAELPPVENLRKFVSMGADLVAFSGGKAIGGPADTGILCGRRDLMRACAMNGFPENYPERVDILGMGRTMKVSKEQIVGLVVALQRYVERDHEADMARWNRMADYLARELSALPHIKASKVMLEQNPRPTCIPKVEVSMDEKALGITASMLVESLLAGEPRVAVIYWPAYHRNVHLNPQCLRDGEEGIVVQRIKEVLTAGKT